MEDQPGSEVEQTNVSESSSSINEGEPPSPSADGAQCKSLIFFSCDERVAAAEQLASDYILYNFHCIIL